MSRKTMAVGRITFKYLLLILFNIKEASDRV
jgi:hypothetical protein